MPSKIDICNLALAHLGDEATVSSIAPPEGSAQAEHCARFYPVARDALLEAHAWTFATTRAPLALLADTPPAGWLYAYARPNESMRLLAVLDSSSVDDTDTREFPLEISATTGARIILTNTANAVACYTFRQDDPATYPPMFVDALAGLLASYLAGPVVKGSAGVALAKTWATGFAAQIAMAKAADANQRHVKTQHTLGWIEAR